ncbi:magnesium-translocating P-type ATPase [Streptomyces californicus]
MAVPPPVCRARVTPFPGTGPRVAGEPGGDPAGRAAPAVQGPTPLQTLRALGSGPRGLVEAEAEVRLARTGENVLPARRPVPWPRRFLRSLRDPFTSVLLCLGLVSAVVSAWGTACAILALVAVSCVLRSAEEHRADRSTASLRELVATTATVVRRASEDASPVEREAPVADLVPGTRSGCGPGDPVPADVQLLRTDGLTVYQSALTGESAPVVSGPSTNPTPRCPEPDPSRSPSGASGQQATSGSGTAGAATGGETRFAATHDGGRARVARAPSTGRSRGSPGRSSVSCC